MKIRYDKIQECDIVHCGARSPLAFIIRIVTAGWQNAFGKNVSTHTGIVVRIGCELVIAEMAAKGLILSSFEKYNKRWKWIISISRPYLKDTQRLEVNNQILNDFRHTLDYDLKGLFEFISKKVKDNKSKNYCSEYVYELLKGYVDFPNKFKFKVSPRDLQLFPYFSYIGFTEPIIMGHEEQLKKGPLRKVI